MNGERTSPIKGLRGTCPYCSGEMVAKCGRFRIWHWAHMPGASCDPWWGPESEWHRDWKGQFPADWREVIHIDEQTGEKHIADVKTPFGLVVEFQHSPIDYTEMASREAFYDNMVWIVDGDRGSLDPNYFIMGSRESQHRFVLWFTWSSGGVQAGCCTSGIKQRPPSISTSVQAAYGASLISGRNTMPDRSRPLSKSGS